MKEEWKQIKDGLNNYYYVSNFGRIKSTSNWGGKEPRILKQRKNPNGYMYIHYKNSDGKELTRTVHGLVLTHFIGPRNGKVANHKDGDKTNNHIDNLEWVSRSENMRHASQNGMLDGRHDRSSKHPLSDNDIIQIRSIYDQGWASQAEIGRAYNRDNTTICKIVNRVSYSDV